MTLSKIPTFKIERWFDEHENDCTHNLAETCVASISLKDLRELSDDKTTPVPDPETKLVYGAIRGSKRLRNNLSNLYSAKTPEPLPADNILITNGAIAANFLALYTLTSKGDHVICHHPTYQQLFSVPESLGAEVSLWRTRPENKWALDVEELEKLIKPNTKMIIINNPQNPTGAVTTRSVLQKVVDVARRHDLILMADEVYRPLFHSISPVDPEFPPSVLSLGYKKTVATGSMSKAFALAGIRIGWVASRSSEIIEACAGARDFTTISVSQVDDQVASFALDESCVHGLLGRNLGIAKANVDIMERFVSDHSKYCEWIKPVGGTTVLVKFSRDGKPVDDEDFCLKLQSKTGVFVAPGNSTFAEKNEFLGCVRMGYCCPTEELKEGLEKLDAFLRDGFGDVALAG